MRRHESRANPEPSNEPTGWRVCLALKLLHRPFSALRHDRILVLLQLLQHWHESAITAVCHGDYRVPAQAGQFGSPQRRASKNLAKFFRTHLSQPIERGINQFWARLKIGRIRYRRFAIPRADVLADIAAVDAVLERVGERQLLQA